MIKLLFGTKKESASKGQVIKDLKKQLARRERLIEVMDKAIKTKEESIKANTEVITTQEALIKAKNEDIKTKETAIKIRDAKLWRYNRCVSQRQDLHANVDPLADPRQIREASTSSPPSRNDEAMRSACDNTERAVNPSLEQTTTGETSSKGPNEAIELEDIVSFFLSFLGLTEFAAGARTCRTWSRAAKSVGNTYWRAIARSRWIEWTTRVESERGTTCDFKSACKEKLRDDDHRLVMVWKQQTVPPLRTPEYRMYHGNPDGVPLISWLFYEGHITGSAMTLSTFSHNIPVPAPIFKRYEASARAMYAGTCDTIGTFDDLLPIPSNISDRRRRNHERARRIIKRIFFKPDGSLMDEMPNFAYRNEVALYFSGTVELLSPAQVVEGIWRLASVEGRADFFRRWNVTNPFRSLDVAMHRIG